MNTTWTCMLVSWIEASSVIHLRVTRSITANTSLIEDHAIGQDQLDHRIFTRGARLLVGLSPYLAPKELRLLFLA